MRGAIHPFPSTPSWRTARFRSLICEIHSLHTIFFSDKLDRSMDHWMDDHADCSSIHGTNRCLILCYHLN